MRTTAFTVVSAFAFAGLLLPTGWQWRTRNFGILLYIFWVSVALVPAFINSIIWRDNTNNVAPVWCDITTKLNIGAQYGIFCADLCSSRYLYLAASTKSLTVSRRSRTIFDLGFAIGFPCLIMVLHVIVQGHRFDIIEGVGCTPALYWSLPAVFIITLPALVIPLVSTVYQVLAMRHFIKQRRSFSKLLSTSSSALTTSRFFRLMALCSIGVLINIPIALVLALIGHALTAGLEPWISWDYVHTDFGLVWQFTAAEFSLIPASRLHTIFLSQWLPAVAAILFFLFFGIGQEALASYKTFFLRILGLLGIRQFAETETFVGSGSTSKSGVTISFPRTPNSPAGASFQTRTAGSEKDMDRDVEKGVVVDASMEYLPEIPPFQRVARESEAKLPGVTLTVEKESAER